MILASYPGMMHDPVTAIQAEATARRLEQLALVDLSRLDRAIAEKVAERAGVVDAVMTFRLARWGALIATAA